MPGFFGNNNKSSSSSGFFGGGGGNKSTFFNGGNKSSSLFGGSSGGGNSNRGVFGSNPSQGQPHSSSGGGFFGSNSSKVGGTGFGGGDNKSGGFFGGGGGTKTGGFFGGGSSNTSSGFGMNSRGGNMFGSNNSSSTPTFGGGSNAGNTTFGSKAGTSGTGMFGMSNQSNSGSTWNSNNSGNKSSFFGSNTSNSNSGSFFGSSMNNNMNSIQANLEDGTAGVNFTGLRDNDHGNDSKNMIHLNTLTAAPSHKNFSLEELRLADYFLKKQGKIDFPIGSQPAQNNQLAGGGYGASNSSNMFSRGGNNTNSSSGFFGSNSNNSQKTNSFMSFNSSNKSTGLFNSSNNTNKSTGLFNSSTANKTSGIGTLQRSNATSSLFGANNKPGGSNSLFGGGNSSTTTSAFGAKTNTSNTLFGQNNNKSTGLFGTTQNKPAFGSGGGFGQSTFGGNKTGFGTSTFGSSSGSSMFGNKNNNTGGSSIFGNNQQNSQNMQQQADNSLIQAYATLNQDPYGYNDIESNFNIDSIDVQKELVLNNLVSKVLSINDSNIVNPYSINDPIHSSAYASMPIKLKLNHRGHDDFRYNQSDGFRSVNTGTRDYRTGIIRRDDNRPRNNPYNRSRMENDLHSKYSEDRRRLKQTVDMLRKDKDKSRESGGQAVSETEQNRQRLSVSYVNYSQDEPLTGPDVISVKVSIFVEDREELLKLSINKNRTVEDLKKLVIEKLKKKYSDIQTSIIKIVHRSRILSENNTLEFSQVTSGMTLDVLVQEQPNKSDGGTTLGGPRKSEINPPSNAANSSYTNSNNLVSSEKIPISTRSDYKLIPNLIEMARMTEDAISAVNNLSIENEHGKITWPNETDAREVNFDELVIIEPYSATVYPEEVENRGQKPVVGIELNKMAVIELYNVAPPKG